MHKNKIVEKVRTGDNTMDELKTKVKDLLIKSKESMTIPQICKNLNIDDEDKVLLAIAELEYINEVAMKGLNKFYQPDGCAGYLAEYEYIR